MNDDFLKRAPKQATPIIDEELFALLKHEDPDSLPWELFTARNQKPSRISNRPRAWLLSQSYGDEKLPSEVDAIYESNSLRNIQNRIANLRRRIEDIELEKKLGSVTPPSPNPSGPSLSIQLVIRDESGTDPSESTDAESMLRNTYAFVSILQAIQNKIDDILARKRSVAIIRRLTHASPINLDVEGVTDAFKVLRDEIVPWRREHAKINAELDLLEKKIAIRSKEADVLETRARVETHSAEAKRLNAEAARILEEAESQRLDNDKKRLEIQKDALQVAISIIHGYAPDIDPREALLHALDLLPAFQALARLPVDFSENK